MEVCFLASGELLAVLDVAEFEGQPGKALKQSLASEVGVTRFRLRIFMDGTEIQDHELLTPLPVKIQLVVLEFWPVDMEETSQINFAAATNNCAALEELLQCPRNPNVRDADWWFQTIFALPLKIPFNCLGI